METTDHWDNVYARKGEDELSWTQDYPRLSLSLIAEVAPRGRVVDVGGGSSPLAGHLLHAGYAVSVVDISKAGVGRARGKLGADADRITWIVADVTTTEDVGSFEVWHDRAVFHFLLDPGERRNYVQLLRRTVPPGGHAVIATFALDGPEKCSGLDVKRYDSASLARELGEGFELVKSVGETHRTPWGKPQSFQYSVLRRV